MNTCWWHRLRLLLAFDARSPLPPRLARHLQHCDACRARWETDLRLANALKQPTFPRQDPAPAARARRIRHALAMAPLPETRRAPSWSLMMRPPAPGLAMALLAALALWRFWPGPPPDPSTAGQFAGLRSPEVLAAVDALWPGSDALVQLSRRLDQPLEAELEAVVNDARSAVQVLASNFLPQQRP